MHQTLQVSYKSPLQTLILSLASLSVLMGNGSNRKPDRSGGRVSVTIGGAKGAG